ncbi:alpha/beta hydrolase [Leptospira bourretii]|uniref:alpha/beta fold hydrolase n=2 Tax=Leptospira TaxID=171 RepID=UPI00109130FF|nr:alpha/beta hydrolase [Leptospira bourretii]TGL22853.1 alpha/beta hydrolase [Leptospira bourretii]
MKNMGGEPCFVAMGGHKIFYWKFGKGNKKPIVFLHGLLDESFGFRRVVKELLNDGYPLYVFDLPGYGKSKLPLVKYLYQIDVWADLLLECFQKLELKDICLVGHSMGGLTSQHLVLQDTQHLVAKLILLAPGGIPHPERERMRKILFPKTEKQVILLLRYLYGEEFPEPGYLFRHTLVTIWNEKPNEYLQENTLRREDEIFFDAKMKGIKIPTLILAGAEDEITPPFMMKKINSYIKKSKLVWIPKVRHAIHLEKPDVVAKNIRIFYNT